MVTMSPLHNRFSAISLVAVLISPSLVLALATEQFGNAPIRGWDNQFGPEMLKAVNASNRVYWYEVNGNPTFYFRGTQTELNEAIRQFSAIPAENREIILLSGQGMTRSLGGEQKVDYNWSLHIPVGMRQMFKDDPEMSDSRVTLTIYIPTRRPVPLADGAQVGRLVPDLNNDDFKVRESATNALAKLGPGAVPLLQKARAASASAEASARLDRLIAAHTGIVLDFLELPPEISVIGVDDLLARYKKALSSKNGEVRGSAFGSLVGCGSPGESLQLLVKSLESEEHEYAIRCGVSALAQLGAIAKPALPTLRKKGESGDKNVRHAVDQAVEMITNTSVKEAEADTEKKAAIRQEIAAFCKARVEKKSP